VISPRVRTEQRKNHGNHQYLNLLKNVDREIEQVVDKLAGAMSTLRSVKHHPEHDGHGDKKMKVNGAAGVKNVLAQLDSMQQNYKKIEKFVEKVCLVFS